MLPEFPECDLLLHAGDAAPFLNHEFWYHKMWWSHDFTHWADGRDVVVIPGNHDLLLQQNDEFMEWLPITYLRDRTVVIDGLVIHGMPWTPPFFNWAFMAEEPEIAERMALVPDNVNVLITHGPPYGILDHLKTAGNVGSKALSKELPRFKDLKLCVSGHIHETRGHTTVEGVLYVNPTRVNRRYEPVYEPYLVDWDGQTMTLVGKEEA